MAQLHSGLWRSGPGRTSLDWILYTSFTSGVACCLPGWSFSGQPTTLASYICIADGEADVSVPTHRSTETPVWCVIVTIPSHQNKIRSLQRRSCRRCWTIWYIVYGCWTCFDDSSEIHFIPPLRCTRCFERLLCVKSRTKDSSKHKYTTNRSYLTYKTFRDLRG